MKSLPMPVAVTYSIMPRQNFLWPHAAYDDWFLIIPITGSFTCTMQGHTWTVAENELCFFPPKVVFDRQVIEPMILHYFQIQWNCSDDELKKNNLYPLGKVAVSDHERLNNTLKTLTLLDKTPVQNRSEIVSHYLSDIWMQTILDYMDFSRDRFHEIRDPVMKKAVDYMRNRIHSDISIEETAAYCGMSHPQFSRRFKETFGCSPIKYMTSLRIEKSKKYLSETDLPISQIAVMCGYENQFYFSRRFRETTGISPQQYRNSLNKV